MKKIYVLLISFLTAASLFGQIDTITIPIDYKAKMYNLKESLAISNNKNKELVILIEDNKKTSLFLIGENGDIKNEIITDKLKGNFRNFLGYNHYDDGTYTIIFSNESKDVLDSKTIKLAPKYGLLKFNFKNNFAEQVFLDFKYKKQNYVESISQNNKFFVMTAEKGGSDNVLFYELLYDDTFKKHIVSFESLAYKTKLGVKKNVADIFTKRFFFLGSLTKINLDSPSSIEVTSAENKLYQMDNELVFTIDNDKEFTNILRVNLSDFSVKNSKFEKPILSENESNYGFSHNSFVDNNFVYQMKGNSNQLNFRISSLRDNKFLKELLIKKGHEIDFKNGPIIQEKEGDVLFGVHREFEKTSKLLRKVSLSNAGISSINYNDKIHLKIGCFKKFSRAEAYSLTQQGIFITNFSQSFNSTFTAYNYYSSNKTTYINCLFDKEFNHIKGVDIEKNIFDIIKDYEVNFDYNERVVKQKANGSKYVTPARMKLKNVFYHNGNHYLGYLNTIDRNYHLVKF